jgi:ribonucrease Y
MPNSLVIGLAVLSAGLGLGFGYLLARLAMTRRQEKDGINAEDTLAKARVEATRLLASAEEEGRAKAATYREREEEAMAHRRLELSNLESRLGQREETLEQRASNLAQREKLLIDRESELTTSRGDLERLKEEARHRLEQLSGIDVTAAKAEMLEQVEDEASRDAMIVVRDLEVKAREEADRRARRILATAIQRLASEVVTETTFPWWPSPPTT